MSWPITTMTTLLFLNGCTSNGSEGCNSPRLGDAPDGLRRLYFSGAILGDDPFPFVKGPLPIALGGTENIEVWLDPTTPFDMASDIPIPQDMLANAQIACPKAFCVDDSSKSILLHDNAYTPPIVKVTGMGEGQDELKINAHWGNSQKSPPTVLLDQTLLSVAAPMDQTACDPTMPPCKIQLFQPDFSFHIIHGDLTKPVPVAVYAVDSKPTSIVVGMTAMVDNELQRLVDESWKLTNTANLTVDLSQWDRMLLNEPFSVVTDYTVTASNRGTTTLRVVKSADGFTQATGIRELGPPRLAPGEKLSTSEDRLVCFSPFVLDKLGNHQLIYGALLNIKPNDNNTILGASGFDQETPAGKSCAKLRAKSNMPPTASVTVSYGTTPAKPFTFDVE